MDRKRTRSRDLFDWISVVVDMAQFLALVVAFVGLLYWYTTKRLPVVTAANNVILLIILGAIVWIAARPRR